MERIKKLTLKKRKTSTSSNTSSKGKDQGQPAPRARRHALIQPFSSSRAEKQQLKQYQAAVESGDATKVRQILETGLELNEIDNDSESLRFACSNAFTETAAVLLRYGAQINAYGDGGLAPVHIAARQGNNGLLALLISQGADVDLQTMFEKKTALHIAALHGRDSIVQLLLDSNANIDSADIYGTTPMHLAARMARMSTLKILFSHELDVNMYDNDGWTALHLAADTGNLLVARLLLQHNGLVDCQNKYGRTPLHWACSKGHLSMVQLLVSEYKAAIGIKDLHGKTAFDYSKDRNITALLKLNYIEDESPGENRNIGQYITIDPRESMLLKVYGDKKPNGLGLDRSKPSVSAMRASTISEDDEDEVSITTADKNSNVIWMRKSVSDSKTFISEGNPISIDVDSTSVCSSVSSMQSPEGSPSKTSNKSSPEPDFTDGDITVTPVHDVRSVATRGETRNPSKQSIVSDFSVNSKESSASDTPSSTATFKEFNQGRDMFRSLMKALTGHNEKLTSDLRIMYNDLSKALLSPDSERHTECMKSARARLELMENSMFDFHDETELQADKIKSAINDFLEKAKEKFTASNTLDPKFYIALFHAIGNYLVSSPASWKKILAGLANGSVEMEYDMEKDVSSAGDTEGDKVYRCLDFLVRYNGTKGVPFIKDLLDFVTVKCGLGDDARDHILRDFINHLTYNKPSNLSSAQMNNLSLDLQMRGKVLALQLGLVVGTEDEMEWAIEPHAKNMQMFSDWRAVTSSSSISQRMQSLTLGLININCEGLLSMVFTCVG